MADLVPLLHQPLRRVRPGFMGEVVFAEKWEALMNGPGIERFDDDPLAPIECVLSECAFPTDQRLASILASVVTWLGTNCGLAMLHEASRLRGSPGCQIGHEYLQAWASENARRRGINHGVRIIEHIVADRPGGWPDDALFITLPEVTYRDLEAVDCLMLWLADFDGQRFLKDAEAEVEVRKAQQRAREAIEFAASLKGERHA